MNDKLSDILKQHAVPDPRIVGKLPRSGIQLDYVGHADITRILLEIDPCWTIEPAAVDDSGLPAVRDNGRMVEAAFWLTVLGHRRYCIGSVETRKAQGDLSKELLSDAIRNGAMRFGIALSLWSKDEWTDDLMPAETKTSPSKPSKAPKSMLNRFIEACNKAELDPDQVADRAGVDMTNVSSDDMTKLRTAFKEMT